MVAAQRTIRKRTVDQCVVLQHVSWETYERLLADYENQAGPRFCYDQGMLEIKVPSIKQERPNRRLSYLIEILTEEMGLDLEGLGSTTFTRADLLKGFEPDSCFYIKNAEAVAGKDKLDLRIDPPPDLVIEVDVSSQSLDKFALFGAVGIPEVWRHEDGEVTIYQLVGAEYRPAAHSLSLPLLSSELVTQFLAESLTSRSSVWLRRVRAWAREQLAAPNQP